ncbi:RNA polymerase III RPC4-domain-containing protein [Lentinula raphanica]|nr:RNA polymerase III RPC4-domain-containing protein [Lentinula raphanica]
MSDSASGSGSKPKAISSLAKRPSEVTRQGTQKLKFVPTLPARRSKDVVKTEPAPDTIPAASSNDRGRGRGRGRGEGTGRGRGAARAPVEMVASGPFALGPAMAGTSSSRRFAQAATPIATPSRAEASSLGVGLSRTAAPSIKREEQDTKKEEQDEEVYSDPDEGVEIIDMENVRQMDWMAPDNLKKEKAKRPKKEDPDALVRGGSVVEPQDDEDDEEDRKELVAMFDDLGVANHTKDADVNTQRLYLFQFPQPFPTFSAKADDNVHKEAPANPASKKVTFAPDVKTESDIQPSSSRDPSAPAEKKEELDGIIGHIEVYRSGARKIRLGDNIVLEVSPASQPSFLEHAVHLNMNESKLAILGEIYRHYSVAPDVDALLAAMDALDNRPQTVLAGEETLIRMDTT